MSSIGNGPSLVQAQATPPPKQIRFVNNEGQPPAKRRRINAACRTCRKRKTRCDGKRPNCATCTENGHDCLGYADVGDGRRDSKGTDAIRHGEDDTEDYEDEKPVTTPSQTHNNPKSFSNGSPKLQRAHAASYSSNTSERARGAAGRNIRGEYRDVAVFSDEEPSPMDRSPPLNTESHRVPYFRYFGPTAIVPGFKQMVVSVREHRRSTGAGSSITMSPGSSISGGSNYGKPPSQTGIESRAIDMPVYDLADALPVHRLIVHLVETFFTHLGCNYPFLRQKTFTQRVEERSVEPILVDAVCSLAARFSDHALLTTGRDSSYPKSDYGHVFAQRAKAAVVDTFPCPTVAAVQACLLLAYEGFGSNQDSALWMYLGCAIRMAVDLGLQKLDGVRHQGQKDPGYRRASIENGQLDTTITAQEKMEIEQERIDTLWAVFMLDRVISSGTGRPVTLRDDDFELSFPAITSNPQSGWPNPFPALIQIIHLYGRVSDLLNNIKNAQDVTPKKIEGLTFMERELTELYQKLDNRLTFNAANFQHYVKSGEGTNFILVHFWFHTLIMLLHQPSLIHSFESKILQLLPNSRELSMSSAKTIADILAFAELIDPKSFIGNPFTSQPMYIAACAFLMESAAQTSSQPTSRSTSPPPRNITSTLKDKISTERLSEQKHSLLASAATQNYQRCYKSLQQLETYWAGTRYILVALDQKAKGIWDPETYTEQEYEAAKRHEMIPNWRRKLSLAAAPSPGARFSDFTRSPRYDAGSPAIDPSHAFGFSLTGTTNSPSSNLTFMYQNMNGDQVQQQPPPPGAGSMIYDPIRQTLPEGSPHSSSNRQTSYQPFPQPRRQNSGPMPPPAPKYTPLNSDSASTSDAEMLLGLQNSPYSQNPAPNRPFDATRGLATSPKSHQDPSFDFAHQPANMFNPYNQSYMGLGGVGDMMMESQEIDMSALGGDMIPWLEYLPQDMLQFVEGGNGAGLASTGHVNDNSDMGVMDRNGG